MLYEFDDIKLLYLYFPKLERLKGVVRETSKVVISFLLWTVLTKTLVSYLEKNNLTLNWNKYVRSQSPFGYRPKKKESKDIMKLRMSFYSGSLYFWWYRRFDQPYLKLGTTHFYEYLFHYRKQKSLDYHW